ncbi:MAG TPA: oligosaccharide flippase family protein [Patescibacteria group bacterium]|nr:oligosaccharide flippase family protein [Patescibacteria group bacterium]
MLNPPAVMRLVRLKWLKFWQNRLARNTIALYGAFLANTVTPLITVPYTVRVLTPSGYGSGAFALSFAGFAGIVAAYGFGLTASREISVHRGDLRAVSRIASEIVSVELLLLAVCFLAYGFLVMRIPRLRAEAAEAWLAYLVVALGTLSPGWLYQGIEALEFSARVGVVLKLAYVPALFLLVRKPGDTPAWLALQAVAAGLGSAWLWVHAWRRLGIRWVLPHWQGMTRQLRQGFAIFFSQSAVALYTSGNVFILGMLTNVTVAGYYGAAERLVKVAMGAWGPLQQAVFPRASRLASESREAALRFAGKLFFLQGGMGAVLSAALLAGAPWIVPLAFGRKFEPSIAVLQILSVLPLLIAVSSVLGIQVMVPFNRDKAFAAVLLAAGLLNVGLGVLLAPRWQASGMAFSVACSECLVTASMFWYLRRNRLAPSMNPLSEAVHV